MTHHRIPLQAVFHQSIHRGFLYGHYLNPLQQRLMTGSYQYFFYRLCKLHKHDHVLLNPLKHLYQSLQLLMDICSSFRCPLLWHNSLVTSLVLPPYSCLPATFVFLRSFKSHYMFLLSKDREILFPSTFYGQICDAGTNFSKKFLRFFVFSY